MKIEGFRTSVDLSLSHVRGILKKHPQTQNGMVEIIKNSDLNIKIEWETTQHRLNENPTKNISISNFPIDLNSTKISIDCFFKFDDLSPQLLPDDFKILEKSNCNLEDIEIQNILSSQWNP